jgi:hypothetical protein
MKSHITPQLEPLNDSSGANSPLLIHSVISSHLKDLGYPLKSLLSMEKCGEFSGAYINKSCGCGSKVISLIHHCSLRTCPQCSKIRSRRIFKQFLPFLSEFPVTKRDFYQFLTISPKNYNSLEEGFKHIKKSFSKFIRRKYIRDRIKGGIYVLETKYSDITKWNIHIHCILYGSWLDYRIRGKCNKCGQNLLKYNKYNKTFYCSNHKCNSTDVVLKQNTRLGNEWKKSSGEYAHIYGKRAKYIRGASSYITKYISQDKTNFSNEEKVAQYIFYTRKKKLINLFGIFFKAKFDKKKYIPICKICGEPINYFFDFEVSKIIIEFQDKPPS